MQWRERDNLITFSSLQQQLSSSSGGCGGGTGTFWTGAASLSSSRSESPASDRFAGKCSSLVSLHLRNIDSELENLDSIASLKARSNGASGGEEKHGKNLGVNEEDKKGAKVWRGSSGSISAARKERSSRRRRRRTSPDRLSLECSSAVPTSSSVDGKTKSLSRLGITKGDPNTSSSNESVYSNK